jgi:hypothetical protein
MLAQALGVENCMRSVQSDDVVVEGFLGGLVPAGAAGRSGESRNDTLADAES